LKKDTTDEETFEQKVERLIKISNDNPLLPESFVPWNTKLDDHHKLMPDSLLSLYGSPFFDELTPTQKRELSRAEIAQVMYSYAWSEELACLFFFRYVSSLKDITSAKCRYVMKEIEEETRHMQMFSMAITKLGVQPLPPRRMHRFAAWLATTLLPSDVMFISVLAIELVTDVYGDELRSQENIFPVLAKISQLHNIEEGRHIHFAELLLKGYVEKAGLIKRSIYSIVVCLNIYFMRTMYVRKEIFKNIGVDPRRYYKPAYSGLKYKFSQHCLKRATKFVSSFNGFNWFTKLFWRSFLGTKF
jgi:hypothetical protein